MLSQENFVSLAVRAFALSEKTNMIAPALAHRTHAYLFRHVSLLTLIIAPHRYLYKEKKPNCLDFLGEGIFTMGIVKFI